MASRLALGARLAARHAVLLPHRDLLRRECVYPNLPHQCRSTGFDQRRAHRAQLRATAGIALAAAGCRQTRASCVALCRFRAALTSVDRWARAHGWPGDHPLGRVAPVLGFGGTDHGVDVTATSLPTRRCCSLTTFVTRPMGAPVQLDRHLRGVAGGGFLLHAKSACANPAIRVDYADTHSRGTHARRPI